jgi:hypothetical protein
MADDYYKRWYRENADKRNAARRKRYASDPEFRAQAQERAREHAREKSAEQGPSPGRWTQEESQAAKQDVKRLLPRVFVVDSQQVLCFSRGALLERLSVGDRTARRWEEQGIVPQPTARDDVKRAWYSASLVEQLGKLVDRGRKEEWSTDKLKEQAGKLFRGE